MFGIGPSEVYAIHNQEFLSILMKEQHRRTLGGTLGSSRSPISGTGPNRLEGIVRNVSAAELGELLINILQSEGFILCISHSDFQVQHAYLEGSTVINYGEQGNRIQIKDADNAFINLKNSRRLPARIGTSEIKISQDTVPNYILRPLEPEKRMRYWGVYYVPPQAKFSANDVPRPVTFKCTKSAIEVEGGKFKNPMTMRDLLVIAARYDAKYVVQIGCKVHL